MSEETTKPTGEQLALAGQLVDLVSTAWSLRARVADTRNLRMGFVVSENAYGLLADHRPDAGFGPAITFDGDRMLLAEIEVRADAKLDEWSIVLALAPGEPT